MKRPRKYCAHELHPDTHVFKVGDIYPLINKLERLKADKKPFTSLEEFRKWWLWQTTNNLCEKVYNYFSQLQYEKTVFPQFGDMIEGEDDEMNTHSGKLECIQLTGGYYISENIRPVTRPTRDELIAKYGITEDELEILRGDK